MSLNMKQIKEMEAEIYEQLYTNIFILTLEFPTTKEFDSCFKRDMFKKNNKAAFLHVSHFLLNILDPNIFPSKIVWPTLDLKMETQFRNDLMKYLNELNSHNKETGIPLIMTSHLISPGGGKFADFMFRLSRFVLAENVRKNKKLQTSVLFPPKADNDHSVAPLQLENLNKIVDNQYSMLTQKHKEFEAKYANVKRRSKELIEHKQILEKQSSKCSHDISNVDLPVASGCSLELIEEKLQVLDTNKAQFKKCGTLANVLKERRKNAREELRNEKLRWEDVKDSFKDTIEEQKNQIEGFKNTEEIQENSLIVHLHSFLKLLKTRRYYIKPSNTFEFNDCIQESQQLLTKLTDYNNENEELNARLMILNSELKEVDDTFLNESYKKDEKLSETIQKIFMPIQKINLDLCSECSPGVKN